MLVKFGTAALLASTVFTQNFSWGDFQTFVKDASFPAYTTEQKVFVADQVNKLMSVYVNRDSKIENYSLDSNPLFQGIRDRAANMTDAELHSSLQKAFLSLRDFHTNYYTPAPYSCYRAVYPLTFELIHSDDPVKNPVAAVSAFSTFPEVVELGGAELKKVKLGHVLVSINGLSLTELYEKYKHLGGGANLFGGLKSVLSLFEYRNAIMFPLEIEAGETHVTYVLKERPDSTRTYSVTVPIAGRRNDDCLANAPKLKKKDEVPDFKEIERLFKKKQVDMSFPLYKEARDAFEAPMDIIYTPILADTLQWARYEFLGTKLGVLRIDGFVPPDGVDTDTTIGMIRSLLVNEFKDTDALVIDLRRNGGGSILMADAIPQLFLNGEYHPQGARALMAPINAGIADAYLAMGGDAFSVTYNQSSPANKYSDLFYFDTVAEVNKLGRVYLKPVAVLNDANCYSACDLLSASMQDSGAASIIFGHDGKTGAGGANVVEHKDFFSKILPSEFQTLPHGQDIRLGWRQLVRNGKNEGKIIEDVGIDADRILRPTVRELTAENDRSAVFDTIAHELRAIGEKDGINAEPQVSGNAEIGASTKFDCTSAYITKLELVLDGKVLDTKTFRKKRFNSVSVLNGKAATAPGTDKYTIVGYVDDKEVLRTYRYIRYTPAKSSYLNLNAGETTQWDFSTDKYALVYNSLTESSNGWNLNNGKFVIGNGAGYADGVNSAVSFFVNVNAPGLSVKLDALVNSEKDYDFFSLTLKQEGKDDVVYFSKSGLALTINESFPLETTGPVELVLSFKADGAVTEAGGIVVNSLSLEVAPCGASDSVGERSLIELKSDLEVAVSKGADVSIYYSENAAGPFKSEVASETFNKIGDYTIATKLGKYVRAIGLKNSRLPEISTFNS
ncbi:hypothetical protein HDU92_005960 [Lobulomyces angularis]|nr:hypothetical protein HDU92_005960 [Lobulomyces angularis]